jgi:RNA polymerase II subunit A C-terminal domain phosphatase
MLSLEEAQKLERETANHLLKSRKLSLIVDLDQTIVHATVDPTVGEWIAEGEAWEARRAKRAEDAADKDSDDSSDEDLDSEPEEECDPNWEAIKDVKKFRLGPEVFGWLRPSSPANGKQNALENQGCMYYIKPR